MIGNTETESLIHRICDCVAARVWDRCRGRRGRNHGSLQRLELSPQDLWSWFSHMVWYLSLLFYFFHFI